ncbi:hypothetical protein Q5424_24155 [Conexibacter sp. JD483]|uniref:shikimate dehydrogenase family protein n=1 Tax=unclassified Conexibacter TaxID=2627773 RepID=UPI00271F3EBA|nr:MULTISPECIES: hypothetical protein [unclassified Conexibacter]MDO8186513.1 hypothetical protein [Conexibacter sp. CPCC 205706]MDO8200082.1 hypothetical protein [Conexibacter sp. CPCC 205762]MDR9372213.1 hypothetical protein [Conexibacter sp. JD483]
MSVHFALLGNPTGHSPAPRMWNGLFARAGVEWRYAAHDVRPGELGFWVDVLRCGTLSGAHVTMPLKAQAADAADVRDADVERAGVANWLALEHDELTARNLDVAAARALIGERRFEQALVLGAGGAARGLLTALAGACDAVAIVSDDAEGAAALARQANGWFAAAAARPWQQLGALAARSDLIVNATPLGMAGRDEPSPLAAAELRPGARLYDLVYRPDGSATPLQAAALEAGAEVVDGLAHFEAQAVASLPHVGLAPALAGDVTPAVARLAGRAGRRWRG